MKNILLVILLLVIIVLLVVIIGFYQKADKYTKSYDEEKYSRMIAEESLQKNAAKIVMLEAKLKAADTKMEKIQDLMDQQKSMNQDLKNEYDKINKAKAELEAQLESTKNSAVPVTTEVIKNEVQVPAEAAK